jgi:hypothetical protein
MRLWFLLTWLGAALGAAQENPAGAWTRVAAEGPSRRFIVALAFDAARQHTVLFGGDVPRVGPVGGTWLWDGRAWRQQAIPEPEPRYGHVMAYDPERKQVVLFGGYDRVKKIWFPETWTWDGAAWTRHALPGPAPRRSPAFAYHPERKTLLLWGGLGEAPDGTEKFWPDTWEFDGTAWQQLATEGPPPAYGAEMAYDEAERRMILFGGNDHSGNVYADTWAWTRTGWTKLASGGPAPRGGAQLAFNPRTRRVHLYGGFGPKPGGGLEIFRDEWAWNGRAWEEVPDPTQPLLVFPRLTYDAARDRLVYFGLSSFAAPQNEVWEKRP